MDEEYRPQYCRQCGFLLSRRDAARHMRRCEVCRAETRSLKQAMLRKRAEDEARRKEEAERLRQIQPVYTARCAECVYGSSCGEGIIFCALPYCIKHRKEMRA